METSTWTPKTIKRSTWTSVIMKRSTCTSKTIGRSKSTYNCQEIDLEYWEDRRGLCEQCRDYYDIAGRARRYTCLLHDCENYELLCTPRYTKISGLCTFWYIDFRVYEIFWYINFRVLCYPTKKTVYIIIKIITILILVIVFRTIFFKKLYKSYNFFQKPYKNYK